MNQMSPTYRRYLGTVGVAAVIAAVCVVFVATVAGSSQAASAVAPTNTGEPSVSGTTMVGEVLRTTNGTWSGTTPFTFTYRWYRCQGRGAADASDCARIANAANATYRLRDADAGYRIRSQVVASNADGQATATSNPTNVIQSARPTNTTEPSITGNAVVGSRLQANRGQWVGETPITYAYAWLRCNAQGASCGVIPGADNSDYQVRDSDLGRRIRVRVTASNDVGRRTAISNPTAIVTQGTPPPPATGTIDASQLQAAGDRLVVAQVRFSPNPLTSRTAPITARVQVTARGGRPVNGARVFMRGTPRVVSSQTQTTGADGWATLTLVPNQYFPQPRNNFNVQFFVKAFRPSDPPLGGVAGYRLVQVPLA